MATTTYEVPLISAAQKFSISLAGTTYILELLWNGYSEVWHLNIYTKSSVLLIGGIFLVANTDLLAPFTYMNIGGSLIARTTNDINTPPAYDNLGSASKLYFVVTD